MISANIQQLDTFIKQRVPMIEYAKLEITQLDDQGCVVKIPFTPQNKNHLNSMYFGSLAIGADASAGLLAMNKIMQTGKNIALVFKDFQANFIKRPEADVFFTCTDAKTVNELVTQALTTGQRANASIKVVATTKSEQEEIVAEFVLTLSIKMAG